jgi:hypothetical protein
MVSSKVIDDDDGYGWKESDISLSFFFFMNL